MKKLMIAAAATAMVGAVYAGCDKPVDPEVDCAEVYDVVMNLKTTKCNCKLLSTTTTVGGGCNKTSTSTTEDCVAWRTVTTKKVYGVIWSCKCTCATDLDEQSPLLVEPAPWDGELDAAETKGNQFFWMPTEKLALDSLMTFKFLGRIGAANGKVEAWGTFGDGVNFAGFGTHGALRTKTISGGVAGCWGAPYDCATVDEGGFYTEDCPIYDLCTPTQAVQDYSKTAVYGSFTVKYNAAKSAKLARGGSLVTIGVIPAKYTKLGAVGAAKGAITGVADAKNPSYESSAM